MIKKFYEINISIDFTVGPHPIRGLVALWLLPKKKLIEIIKQAVERDFNNYLKSQDFEETKDPEIKIIH